MFPTNFTNCQFNCIIFVKEKLNLPKIIILPLCAEELCTAKPGNDLKMQIFVLERTFSFQFVSFFCRFLKSESSLNLSNFDRQDFVKPQNFDGYSVIMT